MRVGVIADQHFPFEDKRYLPFVINTFDCYGVDHVLNIGDVADLYHAGKYVHDLNHLEPARELEKAQRCIDKWKLHFPMMDVCIGNHDARILKRATENGIVSDKWIKPFADAWNTPTWNWRKEFVIDGVLYTHGDGRGGITGARLLALNKGMSAVMGHSHRYAAVHFIAQQGRKHSLFGANVGCGVDKKSYAFAYAIDTTEWVHACAVVLDGNPIVVAM